MASSLVSKVMGSTVMAVSLAKATEVVSVGLTLSSTAALSQATASLGSLLGTLKASSLLGSPVVNLTVSKVGAKAAAAVIGGALSVAAVPLVLGAVGFTGAGITASSLAAKMMSAAAIANGGGVTAGSLVATLQSVGKRPRRGLLCSVRRTRASGPGPDLSLTHPQSLSLSVTLQVFSGRCRREGRNPGPGRAGFRLATRSGLAGCLRDVRPTWAQPSSLESDRSRFWLSPLERMPQGCRPLPSQRRDPEGFGQQEGADWGSRASNPPEGPWHL